MPRIAAADREDLVETRKSQIVDATLRLLASQSFDRTSVDAIAKEAGVSKGSVYLYFESKDAIIDELVRRYSLIRDVEKMVDSVNDISPEDALGTVVPVLWQQLVARRELIKLLLREGPARPDVSKVLFEKIVIPGNTMVADWLARHIGPERAKEIDTFVAGRLIFGMLMAFIITQELLGGKDARPIEDEKITSTITEVFLYGIMGRNGKKKKKAC